MIGKHIVDRYNIYHVYQPTKINRRIHSSAMLYVHIGLILMQFQLFTVIIVKTQYSKITLFVLIVLIISMLIFAFYCSHHFFLNMIHFNNDKVCCLVFIIVFRNLNKNFSLPVWIEKRYYQKRFLCLLLHSTRSL